ncbi:hypothetical protein WJX73_004995 [Symbiochloris irregularis]|uniref:Transcriptional adapter n=1 Tax=Symbiochloris irregularis TaxID=706552 RepID=A0AAW1NID7_9CHLO
MAPPDKNAPGSRVKRRKGPQGTPLGVLDQLGKRAMFHCNNCHDHAYRVVDNLAFPIFHPDWGADEEMLLLEAVDMVGLGNWEAVATHVATKSSQQCMQHYRAIYLNSPAFPRPTAVPDMADLNPMQVAEKRWADRRTEAQQFLQNAAASLIKAAVPGRTPTPPIGGVLPSKSSTPPPVPASQSSTPPLRPNSEDLLVTSAGPLAMENAAQLALATGLLQPGAIKAEIHSATGHKGSTAGDASATADGEEQKPAHAEQGTKQPAGRGKGERGLPGTSTEPAAAADGSTPASAVPSDRAPKVFGNQVEITGYQARRNEFEPEYDNAAEAIVADLEFKEDDTEAERAGKLHLVTIYNARLDQREYRRKFVLERGLLNVRRFQALEKRWSAGEREVHLRMRALARYMPRGEHEALAEGLLTEQRLRSRIQELKEARRAELAFGTPMTAAAVLQTPMTQQSQPWLGSLRSAAGAATTSAAAPGNWVASAAAADSRGMAAAVAADRQRIAGVALNIADFPGTDLLSSKERELCANLRLLPSHYLAAKAGLLAEDQHRNGLPRSDAHAALPLLLDANRLGRIWDLMYSSGWLCCSTDPSSAPGVPSSHAESSL